MTIKALVVGAAGGLGTEVVKQLLAAGYWVIGTVLNDTEATRLKLDAPGVAQVLKLDLADANTVADVIQQSIAEIDAVVICAAICPYGPLELAPLDTLRQTLEINAVSCVAVYQAAMPMLRRSKGRLVFVGSFAGKVAPPFIGHYAGSKHALEGLCDVMRREAKSSDVKVVLIEPGGIQTSMITNMAASIDCDRAALSERDASLFGSMYDSYSALLRRSWDLSLHPSAVAEVIVRGLAEDNPAARYPVGEDSKLLCAVAQKSDEEIDDAVSAFWGP